jgi:hypothetical protein
MRRALDPEDMKRQHLYIFTQAVTHDGQSESEVP